MSVTLSHTRGSKLQLGDWCIVCGKKIDSPLDAVGSAHEPICIECHLALADEGRVEESWAHRPCKRKGRDGDGKMV